MDPLQHVIDLDSPAEVQQEGEEQFPNNEVIQLKSDGEDVEKLRYAKWLERRVLYREHTDTFQRWLTDAHYQWELNEKSFDPAFVVGKETYYPRLFYAMILSARITTETDEVLTVCKRCVASKILEVKDIYFHHNHVIVPTWDEEAAKKVIEIFQYCELCKQLMLLRKTSILYPESD